MSKKLTSKQKKDKDTVTLTTRSDKNNDYCKYGIVSEDVIFTCYECNEGYYVGSNSKCHTLKIDNCYYTMIESE